MDGFSGFKTDAIEVLPDAVEVMDPFHFVKLPSDALEEVRRCIQQDATGHRGYVKDPLCWARRSLPTGIGLLTRRQQEKVVCIFADPILTEIEVTWGVYQDIVTDNRTADRFEGQRPLRAVINALSAGLVELKRLGRTLKKRAADVLAFFRRPSTSSGPTEAINGRIEHLRGSAFGFRNITHYIARSILESGGFRPFSHSHLL